MDNRVILKTAMRFLTALRLKRNGFTRITHIKLSGRARYALMVDRPL